ncbi:MAG: hypothetical protein HYI21_00375 [Sediminibacterium sp. Gen4]|uniref:hypothetical protein n=1 Tax=unclassified Sediminibacterium TaxID=2635961 RepID=UPI0015BF4F33|nr:MULTISPECIES: hypothetical protein [unclassified Sediminibacterium]MBW0161802.1 hypothetical protein [Sediminibacterium sp.]MBW0165007.1 hypothetical protein [Sediminibacterium sp.]NWK64462.1 hypothetical protein [Sediminibacterium sp. Gen4]
MKEDLLPFLPKGIHYCIESRFSKLKKPNDIIIHKGLFTVIHNNICVQLKGIIKLVWLPSLRISFQGIINSPRETRGINFFDGLIQIKIGQTLLGDGFITQRSIGKHFSLSGLIKYSDFSSIKDKKVDLIRFVIPNLKELMIGKLRDDRGFWSGHVELNDTLVKIQVDQRKDYSKFIDYLRNFGGYAMLHWGQIEKIDSKISIKEAFDYLDKLSLFLSFINGRKVSALIRDIYDKNKLIKTDWTPYQCDNYKNTFQWLPHNHKFPINDIWLRFHALCKDKNDYNAIVSLVHWYTSANSNTGLLEGSIIMAQTAIELLFNWVVFEKLQAVDSKDLDKINAASKIRLIWTLIGINESKISLTDEYKNFINNEPDVSTVSQAMSWMRNSIVHGNFKKRIKYDGLGNNLKSETLSIFLWTIECLFLALLKYDGDYINRLGKFEEQEFKYSLKY